MEGVAPMEIASNLFSMSRLNGLTVTQALNYYKGISRLHRVNTTGQLQEFTTLCINLHEIKLSYEDDKIKWKVLASKHYSLASAYNVSFFGSLLENDSAKL